MKNSLFRKAALDKISSPEQLDQLMQVTSPIGWLALTAAGVLLVSALIWGMVGSIPTKVSGQGILMKREGIFNIVSAASGRVREVGFKPGDLVGKGLILVRIDQPDLLEDIKNAQTLLKDMEDRFQQLSRFDSEEDQLEARARQQQRDDLERSLVDMREQDKWLTRKLKNQESMSEEGIISRQTLHETGQEVEENQRKIRGVIHQLQQLDVDAAQSKSRKKLELLSLQQQIDASRGSLDGLRLRFEESSRVVSPYSGRVTQVDVEKGDMVTSGAPVLQLELLGEDIGSLEAVLYFTAEEGKKIAPNMKADIAPSTVAQAKFGYMRGSVASVSEFPLTQPALMRTLQNEALAQELAAGGAVIEVHIDLIPDSATPSGLKWSSSKGPPVSIQAGTLCSAHVTVSEIRPISMVLPIFKDSILGTGK